MYRAPVTVVRLTSAALKAALILVVTQLLPPSAIAQPALPIPIDVLTTAIFDVTAMDQCMARVRQGFTKAGYTNIVVEPNNNGVKGLMPSGENAGVVSMATCVAQTAFTLVIASAGRSAGSGEFAPNSQNSRLMAAILRP